MSDIVVTCSERVGDGYNRPRCSRPAQFYPAKEWNGTPIEPSLHNILCKVHKGYKERSKYHAPKFGFAVLSEEQLAELRSLVEGIRERNRVEAAKKREEADERERRRFAAEWAAVEAQPGAFLLQREDSVRDEDPEFYGFVTPDGKQPEKYPGSGMYRSDDKWFELAPVSRGWYLSGGTVGNGYPYGIRLSRGGTMTPNEARAMAKVLVEAAAKADELNEGRR